MDKKIIDIKNMCNIDFQSFITEINNIQKDINNINLQEKDQLGKLNDLLSLLESDVFFNKIRNYNSMILLLSFDQFECARKQLGITDGQACDLYPSLDNNKFDIDRVSNIIIKYKNEFKKLIKKIITILISYGKLCKNDVQTIIKIRRLISNLGYILVDDDNIIQDSPNSLFSTTTFLILFIGIVIGIVIGILISYIF